jgi:hypothetical protein
MKLENNDTFAITWNAEKHKTRIFRKALWNEKCRQWISKKGDRLLTYFDLDQDDQSSMMLRMRGYNNGQ